MEVVQVILMCLNGLKKTFNNKKLNKMENITKEELELIIFALNETFNDAHKKLQGHQLGDIERRMLEKTKAQSKELMNKLIN